VQPIINIMWFVCSSASAVFPDTLGKVQRKYDGSGLTCNELVLKEN